MMRWENVTQGILIVILLIVLDKITVSFWFEVTLVIMILSTIHCFASKIKFFQKPVSKKRGWLTFTLATTLIIVFKDVILK
ncbi:hypothetical protein [Gottfriedia luciferensis]|uniref:hypothetical protein n=1 Tax=Gottfriedia luciferensis TaxID=178774 RepID=UPI000B42FD31|nr:hypothetical protein [Gottfriedia luciferensis]